MERPKVDIIDAIEKEQNYIVSYTRGDNDILSSNNITIRKAQLTQFIMDNNLNVFEHFDFRVHDLVEDYLDAPTMLSDDPEKFIKAYLEDTII
jgi:hypothetical protein